MTHGVKPENTDCPDLKFLLKWKKKKGKERLSKTYLSHFTIPSATNSSQGNHLSCDVKARYFLHMI
jgi:hypothetical protein